MEDLNNYVPDNWKRFSDAHNIVRLAKSYDDAVKFYDEEKQLQGDKSNQQRDRNRLYSIMMSRGKGLLKSEDVKAFIYISVTGGFYLA